MKKANNLLNNQTLTVSELNALVKSLLEHAFPRIMVRGEVSNAKRATSGYWYFSLKDKDSIVTCAYFKKTSGFEAKKLEDGKEYVCTGRISLYAPRGSYQFIAEDFTPVGEGLLQVEFEKLKTKLQAEGLFDESIKKKIPSHPSHISIVTSPTGAAIQDILNILKRRAPLMKVTVIPALVQGKEATKEIIKGIRIANKHNIGEVLILARGGGSIEDMWCFNDEVLAREIRNSKIPIISAVGHEIDFTIADFASDLRAPTPSAAAELVSKNQLDTITEIHSLLARISGAFKAVLNKKKYDLAITISKLKHPRDRIIDLKLRLDDLIMQSEQAIQNRITKNDKQLAMLFSKLESLSPLSVLSRGYSLITNSKQNVISSANELSKDEIIYIKFKDSAAKAKIL